MVTTKNLESESREILDSDETKLPINEAIPDPNSDLSPVTSSRSRRPTLAGANIPTSSYRRSSDDAIETAKKEKWTVERVFKVTWAYVTTLKVLSRLLCLNDRDF